MKYIVLFNVLLINLLGFTQTTYPLSGKLKNAETKELLVGATVFVLTADSSIAGGTISNSKGEFSVQLKRGHYILKINYLGLNEHTEDIRMHRDEYLGTLYLSSKAESLEGLTVKQKALQATVNGDTTSYNAKSYKTNQNANAQDLIEKMPGVQNTNGEIKAQGESVKQVLVDGKQFFGQDPKTALATLPAEVVDKIQIFDDKSEQSKASGIDDGTRIKTINIVTKINMRNGEFGKVYAGYGTDESYSAGGNINMFRGDRRLSMLGQTNNINQQNFSTEDLLGVVGDNSKRRGRRGGRGPGGGRPSFLKGFSAGGSSSDFMVASTGGITQTIAGGLNYQDKWGDKIDISGSYFYNNGDNYTKNNTRQVYYLGKTQGQEYNEIDSVVSTNINHKLNAKLVYKPSARLSFFYIPSVTIQQNDGVTSTVGNTTTEGSTISSLTQNFSSDLGALKLGNDLMMRLNGEKRGRSFFVQFKSDIDRLKGDNELRSRNEIASGSLENVDQLGNLDEDIDGIATSIMYSEPLGNKGLGAFISYDFSNSESLTNKETYSGVNVSNVGLYDTLLSSKYNNDWNIHTAGLGIRKFGRGGGFVARLKVENALLDNNQEIPVLENVDKSFLNILPFALYRAKFKNKASWFTMYRTYSIKPQASQLTNTVDNTNPLQLSSGNSGLTQQYGHWFMTKYNVASTKKNTIFYAMINGGFSNSYIGQSTFTARNDTVLNAISLARGSQLSQPINLSGQYTANTFVTYGVPVEKLKSNLNFNLSAGLANIPSLINDEKSNTFNQNYGLGVVLSSNISENIDFTISTESSFNISNNSLSEDLNTQYLVQTSKIKYDWIMPYGFTFRTQLQHQEYLGLSDVLNNRVLLWTAGIGRQLFENKRGEIQLSMYDILGQNNNISQNFYDSYYEETNGNVLTRYAMLSFSYNLRKFREDKKASSLSR